MEVLVISSGEIIDCLCDAGGRAISPVRWITGGGAGDIRGLGPSRACACRGTGDICHISAVPTAVSEG